MASVWKGSCSAPPCLSCICFTMGQELVLPHCHGSGIIPSRRLAKMFWKARGFTGTGADCFRALGLGPRQFPWDCLFMAAAVSVAVITWCCATVCPRNPSTMWCWSSCTACVSQSCKIAIFSPKETGLQCFYVLHTATASCTSSFFWYSVECFPL